MATILVGERMVAPKFWHPHDEKLELDFGFLLKLGAFGKSRSRTLLDELGVTFDDAVNLLMPGPAGAWDHGRAREVASLIRGRLERYELVLLAGVRVTNAFRLDYEPLKMHGRFLSIPHPSGRNRWWNDPEHRRRCTEKFSELRANR